MSDEVESTSLGDILSGKESQEDAAPQEAPTGDKETAETPSAEASPEAPKEDPKAEKPAEKPEADTDGERPRDEKGRFVPKEEADAIKKALREERRKRQEAEAKFRERDEPKKDPFEDPEGFIADKLSKTEAAFNDRFFAFSEHHAKLRHEDYDEVINDLLEEAETDPDIARQIYPQAAAHVDPAEFLYSQAKQRKELREVDGDLGKYRETIEQPLQQQLKERDDKIAELESQLKNLGRIKPSMNDEQSASGGEVAEDAANESTPMTDILKPKKRRA